MLARRMNDCEMNVTKKNLKSKKKQQKNTGEACKTAVSLLNNLIFHMARLSLFFQVDYIE